MGSKKTTGSRILLLFLIIIICMPYYISYTHGIFTNNSVNVSIIKQGPTMIIRSVNHINNESINKHQFNLSTLSNHKISWNLNQSTLIIIGSQCAGTITICNQINKFTHFQNNGCDNNYLSDCEPIIPKYTFNHKNKIKNKINERNKRFGNAQISKMNFQLHDNWYIMPWNVSSSKCKHPSYLYSMNDSYHMDQSSLYILHPYTSKWIAMHSQQSVIIYHLREKMGDSYSRLHTICNSNQQCIKQNFQILSNRINEAQFKNYLIPMLNMDQTDQVRDKIVAWYVSYWYYNSERATNVNGKFYIFDICPYVNVLLWMRQLKEFNNNHSFHQFKIIQFEYLMNNFQTMLAYYYCIAVHGYQLYDNQCVKFFINNKHNGYYITEEWDQLHNKMEQHSGEKYEFELPLQLFSKFESLFNICDVRLYDLLKEYPSLVLGEFGLEKWSKLRMELKQKAKQYNISNI